MFVSVSASSGTSQSNKRRIIPRNLHVVSLHAACGWGEKRNAMAPLFALELRFSATQPVPSEHRARLHRQGRISGNDAHERPRAHASHTSHRRDTGATPVRVSRGEPVGSRTVENLVPEEGLEPSRSCEQRILSPSCLPFHHSGLSGPLSLRTVRVSVGHSGIRYDRQPCCLSSWDSPSERRSQRF